MKEITKVLLCVWMVLTMALSCQAQLKPGDVVYQNDFSDVSSAKEWHFDPQQMQWDHGALRVESQDLNKSAKIFIPLPVEKLRAMQVQFGALVKAQNVAKPAQSYHGVKVMLQITLPHKNSYPQRNDVYGTFDWQRVESVATIPSDATAVYLVLGLEQTTGVAWFDDIKITIAHPPRQRPEHPAAGPLYTGHPGIPRLRGAMIRNSIDPASTSLLGTTWNANVVRFQLVWWGAPLTDEAYNQWLDKTLKQLDAFLVEARKDGLMVVVDLHTLPGGRLKDVGDRIFQEKRYQDKLVQVWDKIARRYRGNTTVWGYDLANEPKEGPIPPGLLDWHDLATKVAQTVRRDDPDHAIIVQPEGAGDPGQAIVYFEPIPVPGVVYSIHFYLPWPYAAQGVNGMPVGVKYPGTIGGKYWDKKQLEKALQPVIEFQHDYNVQIYVGEAGVVRWAPDADRWLDDVISIFEENGWDWTYHAFREWHGWNVELGSDQNNQTPSPVETDREKVIRSWFAKNQKPAW